MKKTFFILLTALLLLSCDPVHYIDLRNRTEKEAIVTIKLKPHADKEIYRASSQEHPIYGDSIVLRIPAKETGSLFFGMGSWGDAGVTDLADTMKSLEIETYEIKTIYKTPAVIEALLLENRKGIWFKSEIGINIK